MKNIDLHCHPSQKTMLTRNTSPNQSIDFDTKILFLTDEMVGDILDTQSDLTQLQSGQFKLVLWSIYTLEREVISLSRIQEAIRNEKDKDLIAIDFLEKVAKAEISYFEYMRKEWDLMKNVVNNRSDLKLISNIGEMEEGKTNIFPSLEGSHAFITSNDEDNYIDSEILTRIKDFIESEPLSFITLTHFTDKQLFTHCYALKLATKLELRNSKFYPKYISDKGYSILGETIVDVCLDANKAIDIKHTSLLGRLNIYEHIKRRAPNFRRLMCSHAGITGMSYQTFFREYLITSTTKDGDKGNRIFDNRNGYIVKLMYHRKKGPLKLSFNPQTINLYDEDIVSIIEMGGIVGLSTDQRILGASSALDRLTHVVNYHSDFLTLEEFIILCDKVGMAPEDYLGENFMYRLDAELVAVQSLDPMTDEEDDDGSRGFMDWKSAHRKRFAQSILHILNVGSSVTDTPWDHIAFGSDYDGLVDAINCCRTSAEVPSFKRDLIALFERLEKKGDYSFAISPENLIRKIFEENVIEFYKRSATA